MAKYHVRSIDAWGNETDGWEQNDYSPCGSIELDENATDGAVIAAMVSGGFLTENATEEKAELEWFGEGELGEIRDRATQEPLFQLALED
jgi:hypothetical protein